MKQLFCLLFIISSVSLFSQEEEPLLKNSFGLSLNTLPDAGNSLNPDYKRLMNGGYGEFRASISLNPLVDAFGTGASIGYARYYSAPNKKLRFYSGADLSYARRDYRRFTENFDVDHDIKLEIFSGLEYNPTNRLSLFLEQDVIDLTLYDSQSFTPNAVKLNLLQGTSFGIKYRFN
jgi:hypothetical protein